MKEHHKISNIQSFVAKMQNVVNADNIASRSLQFSVILDHKREMVTRLYYPHFTTFCNETLEYY